jgi:hypothetical protein
MHTVTKYVLLVVFIALTCMHSKAQENNPLKEFGTKTFPSTSNGILFYDGHYIETPYVIERRGLDIFINNKLVQRGPVWTPEDVRPVVLEDPGDPPPALSPLDCKEGDYWCRKWDYLLNKYDSDTARAMIIDCYKNSPMVQNVKLFRNIPSIVTVTGIDGRSSTWTLMTPAKSNMKDYVMWLDRDGEQLRKHLDLNGIMLAYAGDMRLFLFRYARNQLIKYSYV